MAHRYWPKMQLPGRTEHYFYPLSFLAPMAEKYGALLFLPYPALFLSKYIDTLSGLKGQYIYQILKMLIMTQKIMRMMG